MVTPVEKARIVQLKGLGFEYREIAEFTGLSKGQVVYWARKIERMAREEGVDVVYTRILADAALPTLLNYAALLEKVGD